MWQITVHSPWLLQLQVSAATVNVAIQLHELCLLFIATNRTCLLLKWHWKICIQTDWITVTGPPRALKSMSFRCNEAVARPPNALTAVAEENNFVTQLGSLLQTCGNGCAGNFSLTTN